MRADILNPFLGATLDVLRTMARIEPKRGEPRLKGQDDGSYDVSGVVGLTGQVQGFVSLSFRESAALHVVGCFVGEPVHAVDEHVKDAVGELANMVAGGAKRALAAAGYDLRISIPSVIVGRGHSISRPKGVPCIEIPFETEAGAFSVDLCLKLEP
jgi:chemotaxis protein CheX